MALLVPLTELLKPLKLIKNHLLNYRSLKNLGTCRDFVNYFSKILGKPVYYWESMLIYIIVNKLPFPIKKEWKANIAEKFKDNFQNNIVIKNIANYLRI